MKKLFYWISDYWYLFKRSAVMYIFVAPPKHHLGRVVKGKKAVVIIPGIFGRWSFMRPVTDTLSLAGHPVYVIKRLRNNLLDIPTSSKIVSSFIKNHNLKDVILVTHSKGGLIARYLIEYHDPKNKIAGVIALAAPFSGSSMVKLVPKNALLELLPDSVIITKLQSNKKFNKKIISIIPKYDNHVWSEKGSWLEGALKNIKVDVSGHHKIISDKKTLALIKKFAAKF